MDIEIEGMEELKQYIGKIEKLPQKIVTRSAKMGATISLKTAKGDAPFFTGDLESSIMLKAEKTKTKGKKVYQVVFNRAYNDTFQKKSKSGKVTGYYPASMEYGWTMRNGLEHEGLHFMRESVTSNAAIIEDTIVNNMISEIDKLE